MVVNCYNVVFVMFVLTVWFVWMLRVWSGSLRLLVYRRVVGCYVIVLLCCGLGCCAAGVCLVVARSVEFATLGGLWFGSRLLVWAGYRPCRMVVSVCFLGELVILWWCFLRFSVLCRSFCGRPLLSAVWWVLFWGVFFCEWCCGVHDFLGNSFLCGVGII